MTGQSDSLIDRYLDWLRTKATEREIGAGWKALTLPYLDRHNDHLEVFVQEEQHGGLRITDDGRTFRDLKRIGCDLKAPTKRRLLAEKILRKLGLSPKILDSEHITATAVNGEFPRKLHSTLMSMLAIDSLANVSRSNIAAMFEEDVVQWATKIRPDIEKGKEFIGHSNISHKFDLWVPPRLNQAAKVIHAIPNPDKIHINSFTYEVIDTQEAIAETEGSCPEFYAVLNDSNPMSKRQFAAMLAHQIRPVLWSEREQHARELQLTG